MTSAPAFKVYLHRELVDELDYGFSPLDGIQAINDIFVGLPLMHPMPLHKRRRPTRNLRLFSGRFEWYPELAFTYVQLGDQLHVLELWARDKHDPVDVVLPETELERHGGPDLFLASLGDTPPASDDCPKRASIDSGGE